MKNTTLSSHCSLNSVNSEIKKKRGSLFSTEDSTATEPRGGQLIRKKKNLNPEKGF